MVYRDGTSAESGTHGVEYIPHMVIIDGDGKSLEVYDSTALGQLDQNGTLPDTIHDKALSYKEQLQLMILWNPCPNLLSGPPSLLYMAVEVVPLSHSSSND